MQSRRSSMKTSALPGFYRELRLPGVAITALLRNRGRTIQTFQNSPGISSVRILPFRIVEIRGESDEAVKGIAWAIECLVRSLVVKNTGSPSAFLNACFCKSLADPLLAVNKICFEKFLGETYKDRKAGELYFCFKSGERCEAGPSMDELLQPNSEVSRDMDTLSAQFSSKMTLSSNFSAHWDFSGYKSKLLSCLQSLPLPDKEMSRTNKVKIRFGKELFVGPDLQNRDFFSLSLLQELYWKRHLNSFFSTVCSEMAVRNVRLQLERLQYVKVSSQKKVIIYVADLKEEEEGGGPPRFYVSVRCDNSSEHTLPSESAMAVGLEEKPAVISSVRRLARRHMFVAFCREGQTTSDFRMGFTTHEADVTEIPPEMVEWVEQAWGNRTLDQLLVFPPPGRFLVINILYKETETFLTEDWKFRISQVKKGDRINMEPNKTWECRLSSRWFKWNYGIPDTANNLEDMDSCVESDVVALVKEAVKFSEAIEF